MTDKLTPVGYNYGGNPEYDVAPIDETEEWRSLPEYPELFAYEVSNQGRIRNVKTGTIRKQRVDRKGYHHVMRGVKWYPVHHLVLSAFGFSARPDGAVTRHLDGDPGNNVPDNLAWGTYSENEYDIVRHGRHQNARKTHCPANHPYDEGNTIVTREGWRRCRTCESARGKARSRTTGAFICPNCGSELNFSPSHDVYTEGFAPEARPDVWRCVDCRYTWAE